jgi:prevent-host-death family protein
VAAARRVNPIDERASRANFAEMQVNMHDAKSNLSKLVEAALDGEDVVIARAGKPVARLVPYAPEDARPVLHPFGLHAGQVWMADDWDAPDPELEAIWDEKFGPWPESAT